MVSYLTNYNIGTLSYVIPGIHKIWFYHLVSVLMVLFIATLIAELATAVEEGCSPLPKTQSLNAV
jgi:hypothetical protein